MPLLGQGWDDPQSAAIMALAGGLLQKNMGAGLLGANQAYQQAKQAAAEAEDRKLRTGLLGMQVDEMKRRMATEQQISDAARNSYVSPEQSRAASIGPMPDGSNMQGPAPGFDSNAFLSRAWSIDPMKALSIQQAMAKETPFGKVDPKDYTPESVRAFAAGGAKDFSLLQPRAKREVGPGGQVYDPYAIAPGQVLADPNKPFSIGPQGLVPNTPFQTYETNKARAGATNVSVNTEKNLLGNIAEGLGKGLTDAKAGAQSSLGTINTVNRLNDALDSGKMMAGPGTKFRQFGLQVGQVLGVGGKNAQETLLNTRQAIQSLAQLELDGAQQMKGQGQITEAERAIIKRAASGDVDSMTAPELRLLGGILDRSARWKIRNYNQQVTPLANNPNAAAIAPFLSVQEPPQRQAPNVLRFDAQGNPITE